MFDLVVRGGEIVDWRGQERVDLAISAGKIEKRGVALNVESRAEIDASGKIVIAGLIDAHVHLNEPGRIEWEGFETGTAALAAGGATSFVDMPLNSDPPLLDAETFAAKATALRAHSCMDGALWGGLVPENLEKLHELAACGVLGFKAFMSNSGITEFGRADKWVLTEGMKRAVDLRLPVAVHAESEALTARLTKEAQAQGAFGVRDYLDSRPIEAELQAIQMALEVAWETGAALHVVHVSSAAGLKLIADAKKSSGVNVTAETCPHYLLLNEDDVVRLGAPAKCAPPLRAEAERELLWKALAEGLVETIGSDHSPAPPEMKVGDNFFKIWGGIGGCQHGWIVMLEQAVKRGLDLSSVVRLGTKNVADRFRLAGKGDLQVGSDADFVIISTENDEREITTGELLTRHKISPYVGMKRRWKVEATYARGKRAGTGETGRSVARILRPFSL